MISIITPVLNGRKFIEKNIESIRKLEVPYEHVIVDGGSTDGTLELLNKYDHLIIIDQKDSSGMYGAIDVGILNSRGDYLCWVNCDDQIIKEGFESMYKNAIKNQLDFACSNGIFIYQNSNKKEIIRGTRFCKYFLRHSYFPFVQPSTLFSKKLYNVVGGFDYKHFKIAGDGDLYTRMALINDAKFGYTDIETSIFLVHDNSLGTTNQEQWHREVAPKTYLNRNNPFDRALLKLFRFMHL